MVFWNECTWGAPAEYNCSIMYHFIYFLQEPGQEMREGVKNGTIPVGKPLTKTERIIVGVMAIGASAAAIVWAFSTLA